MGWRKIVRFEVARRTASRAGNKEQRRFGDRVKDWTCGWNVEPEVAFSEGENINISIKKNRDKI